MAKKVQKKPLTNAAPEKCFWVCNGKILKNLKELAEALEKMAEGVFKYHVTKAKNDFAKWVTDVFGEAELAKDISKAKTAKGMARKLKART